MMTREQYEKWKEEHPGIRIFIHKRSVLDAFETPEELTEFIEMLSEDFKRRRNDGTTPEH